MRFARLSFLRTAARPVPSAPSCFVQRSTNLVFREGLKTKPSFPDSSSQITGIPRANSHISRLMRHEQRESGRGVWILFNVRKREKDAREEERKREGNKGEARRETPSRSRSCPPRCQPK